MASREIRLCKCEALQRARSKTSAMMPDFARLMWIAAFLPNKMNNRCLQNSQNYNAWNCWLVFCFISFHLSFDCFLRFWNDIQKICMYIYIYCFRRIRFSMWIYDVDSPLACQPPHLSTTQGNHWRSYHAWTNKSQEDCILVVCWGQRRHETIKDCWFICCLLWGQ